MIATTPSQSARLIACGVDPKTADMCLSTRTRRADGTPIAKKSQTTNLWVGYPCWRTTSGEEELENIPAWSLSALLSLIPHVIEVYDDGDYYFSLAQEFPASEDYHAAYKYCLADDDALVGKYSSCPIEACVQLIEWLTANGYQLNEVNFSNTKNKKK